MTEWISTLTSEDAQGDPTTLKLLAGLCTDSACIMTCSSKASK